MDFSRSVWQIYFITWFVLIWLATPSFSADDCSNHLDQHADGSSDSASNGNLPREVLDPDVPEYEVVLGLSDRSLFGEVSALPVNRKVDFRGLLGEMGFYGDRYLSSFLRAVPTISPEQEGGTVLEALEIGQFFLKRKQESDDEVVTVARNFVATTIRYLKRHGGSLYTSTFLSSELQFLYQQVFGFSRDIRKIPNEDGARLLDLELRSVYDLRTLDIFGVKHSGISIKNLPFQDSIERSAGNIRHNLRREFWGVQPEDGVVVFRIHGLAEGEAKSLAAPLREIVAQLIQNNKGLLDESGVSAIVFQLTEETGGSFLFPVLKVGRRPEIVESLFGY